MSTRKSSTRSAVIVAIIGGAAALIGSDTQAGVLLPARWTGTATCTLTTTGPYGYSDRQTNTWTIGVLAAQSQSGATRLYADEWADTGVGSKTSVSWTVNGHGAGNIGFRTDAQGMLHIGLASNQLRDNTGITVRDASSPLVRTYSAPAYEWQFPAIIVAATQTDVVSAPMTVPVNGSIGFQQPGGSTTAAVCSWNFHYGPVEFGPRFPHR